MARRGRVASSDVKENSNVENQLDKMADDVPEEELNEEQVEDVPKRGALKGKRTASAKKPTKAASKKGKDNVEPIEEEPEDQTTADGDAATPVEEVDMPTTVETKRVVTSDEVEDPVQYEEIRNLGGRRAVKKAPAAKAKGGRGKKVEEEEEEEAIVEAEREPEGEQEEKVEYEEIHKRPVRRRKVPAMEEEPEVEQEEEIEYEEIHKIRGGRGRKASAKGKTTTTDAEELDTKKETVEAEKEGEEEEKIEYEEIHKIRGGRGRKAAKGKTTTIDEDEPDTKKAKSEEEEEEETTTRRGRKPAASKGKKEINVDEVAIIEEEEEEEAPKKRGGRKVGASKDKQAEPGDDEEKKVVGRPKRAAAQKTADKAVDEDDEEEEAPKKRGGRKPAALKGKKAEPEDDEEEKVNARPKRGAAKKAVVEDDEEEEGEAPKKKGGRKAAAAPKRKKGVTIVDDEEEDVKPSSSKIKKEDDDDDVSGGKSGTKSGASGQTKSIRRTVQVKGRAAVDPLCQRKAMTAHVYADGDLIYDVMLNQTNIGNNNNKYYIIQLLEDDEKDCYSVWFRWGRVGYDGQNKLVECGTNLARAKKEFGDKFEAKTRNTWPTSFDDFESYQGKYTMIEMDYGNGEETDSVVKMEKEQEEEEEKCQVKCELDERIQHVISLICSIRTMTQTVKEMEYDAEKSPLGKLTQQQISEGYACLKKIEEFMTKKSFGAEFKQAVNEYYTKIPHACGFRPPEMIKTPQKLKAETELLDLLSDIEIAIKTMKQETKQHDVHPVDRHYASLHCGLSPMEAHDEEYKLVTEYLEKTHGATHCMKMIPKNVFRVDREGEDGHEEIMEKIGNRKLLWHGSRLSNFFGILSQGLRIAPPEAPCTGYMFGKGVYFADMATKSGNYCYANDDGQTGFLLLAEVALGELNQLKNAKYDADKLPKGKHSTWGLGRTQPHNDEKKMLWDKVEVPCGRPVPNPDAKDGCLLYNEFIVYNTQQIRMRYLIEVQFKF